MRSVFVCVSLLLACAHGRPSGVYTGVTAEYVQLSLRFAPAAVNVTGGVYGWKGPYPCLEQPYTFNGTSGDVLLTSLDCATSNNCLCAFFPFFYPARHINSEAVRIKFSAYQNTVVLSYPEAPPFILTAVGEGASDMRADGTPLLADVGSCSGPCSGTCTLQDCAEKGGDCAYCTGALCGRCGCSECCKHCNHTGMPSPFRK